MPVRVADRVRRVAPAVDAGREGFERRGYVRFGGPMIVVRVRLGLAVVLRRLDLDLGSRDRPAPAGQPHDVVFVDLANVEPVIVAAEDGIGIELVRRLAAQHPRAPDAPPVFRGAGRI